MDSFSSDSLRLQTVIHQAQRDAFDDAKTYLQVYDNEFERLKNRGVVNLLEHRLTQHQKGLQQREENFAIPSNSEDLEGKLTGLRQLMGQANTSQSRFLPSS